MHFLIIGATGATGSAILTYALTRPEITHITTATRKPLPNPSTTTTSKYTNVIISDFGALDTLPPSAWTALLAADAIVWAAGTYDVNPTVNLHYPLEFQRAFISRLHSTADSAAKTVRFILLSGTFVVRDQSASLWWMAQQRQQKGELENATLALEEAEKGRWEVVIMRPAWISFGEAGWKKVAAWALGERLAIRSEILAAFVGDVVVCGKGSEGGYVENVGMVRRGRRALERVR